MSNADQTVTNMGDMGNMGADDNTIVGSDNCLPTGTRLAEFEITDVIGEGGFGIVYLAFDHSLQRTVALKEYMPAALASRGADQDVIVRAKRHEEAFAAGLRSFINEARLLAQFDHSALVKVYRFWEQNKTAYMAMRYYEGETFKRVVKHHPEMVDEAWLKRILKPILEALDALYKANILHRDISPENIMIQPNGEAVLLDFGAARQIVTGLTKSLTVILKPGYAPVEQYADDESMKQGPWTDIYSLSAVMYAAIAKKPPPTAVTRMLSDPIEPLQKGDYPGFDKGFLAGIDRGLAVRPDDRPQSIAEFARLLGIDMSVPSHAEAIVRPFPTTPAPARPADSGKRSSAKKTADPTGAAAAKKKSRRSKPLWPMVAGVGALAVAGLLAVAIGLGSSGRHGSAPEPVVIAAGDASMSAALPATAPPVAAPPAAAPKAEAPPPAASGKDGASASAAVAAQVPAKADEPAVPKASARHKNKAAQVAASHHAADAAPKNDDDNAVKPTGSVTLAIKPWGNVFVDGEPKGVSPPLKKLSLTEGRHQVRVVNPNFPEYTVNVAVGANKTAVVSRDFSTASAP